jgi:hypothetical protein
MVNDHRFGLKNANPNGEHEGVLASQMEFVGAI